ncbi:MAG: metal ABC transporter permease [Myxococcota bacterium]|jgi:zinc transport system permease protein|nr:metal ABC transporter permease [Myxococcota bacterium]
MIETLSFAFFQRAIIGGLLISVACGIVGSLVVVKRMSSVSGSISHAAFGGVGLGYFFGFDPMLGAAGFSVLSSVGIGLSYRRLQGSFDTLLSMIWSLGMAVGLLFIALSPGYAPDLMSYLFGSILLVPEGFLWFAFALDAAVIVVVALLFREIQVVVFDEEFAQVSGVNVEAIWQTLLIMTALTVVTVMKVVGAILVIALLTFPPAIARQFCTNLKPLMLWSVLISAATTMLGLFGSVWLGQAFDLQLPTGPLVILIAAGAYLLASVGKWKKKPTAS